VRFREDMLKGFERHDRMFTRVWSAIERLYEGMVRGFERIDRRIIGLDAGLGIETGDAFKEGLWCILEK